MAAEALVNRDSVAVWDEYRRTRDVDIRNSLVMQNLGLVYRLANQYAALAVDSLEDLVQEGCLGLIRAVERFRPEYGVRFSTYAYPVISGSIRNHLRSRRRLLGKGDRSGHQAEVPGGSASLPSPVGEELVAPEELEQLAGTAEGDFADEVVVQVLTGDLLARLPDVERRIVTHFFYDDLTQREIGRLVARSNSRVCRLLRRALDRLRTVFAEVQREERRVEAVTGHEVLRASSVVDVETGLFGPAHLRRCLTREIGRAEALGAPLSLVLVRPGGAHEQDASRTLVRAARHIHRRVRVLDHVFRAGRQELALILSLPASAAVRVCERLGRNGPSVPVEHAIGSYPKDATTASGLLAAAHAELDPE